MSLARRAEILDICRSEGVLVLEDNPYGLLGFDSEPMRALRADEPEGVVYLGSFSKTFSPGMRVGWALAPHAVREKLVLAQESATLCPPAFNQMAVSAYLAQHDWQGQIKQMREMYRERRDAMIEALHDFMPAACQWNVPHGGFFVWMTLPPGIDAKAMLPRAVTARVAYVPGTAFFADGFGSGSMRLSFCYPTPERIREGVRRLAGVLEEEMELRETFGADAGSRIRAAPQRLRRPRDGPVMRPTIPIVVSSPAGSPTSATSRCAPVAAPPRRCATPGSRWSSATSTPASWPRSPPTRPRVSCRCCTARAARTARSARSSTCSRSPTSGRDRPPAARRSTSRSPSRSSSGSASPRRGASACRTRRSASSGPPR